MLMILNRALVGVYNYECSCQDCSDTHLENKFKAQLKQRD